MTEFSLEKKGKKKEIEKSLIDKYFVDEIKAASFESRSMR